MLDVPWQIWSHLKKLRMSKEDVRQEHKESEGDPHVKARIRQQQRQAARRRMMSEVPKADVVVTNPTHYAVALKYDEEKSGAPRVIAKGTGLSAAKIRELAAEHRVPTLEAPPLARALHQHVELGQEIPGELYTAVAEVLAWVFQLRSWRSGWGVEPTAPTRLAVPAALDPQANTAAQGRGRPCAASGGSDPDRDGAGHDGAAPAHVPAGLAVHLQHRVVRDDPAGGHVHAQAAGLRRGPGRPAVRDPAAPVAERGVNPRRAAQRPYRPGRGGQGDRGVRPLPRGRQLRRRDHRVRDPDHHQLRGHHQGRRPRLGSDRALHPGRDARQADGDRRRPQRRIADA
ncbi:hypothetical protein G6F31_014535 [Rhizopus arrhizus]|nr:hypothetical protein G6F31_014535 [Rhizopus arrhizus]